MKYAGLCMATCAIVLLMLSGSALAQKTVHIREKPRPEYDAQGINLGGFTLLPELTVGETYSDNIYATKNDETSDWITTVAPTISLESDWSRHALNMETGMKGGFYSSESDENYVDGRFLIDGRLDVLRESFLTAMAGTRRLHEERGDPDFGEDWDEPSTYYLHNADLSYYHGRGKLSVTGGTGVTAYDYKSVDLQDGGSENMDYRDRKVYNVNARVEYDLHPDANPFITSRYNWRDYDESDAQRDSQGYRVGAGTGFDLGGVTSGEVFGGYMAQDYDDRSDISGPWYGMSLLWNVTTMTSVEAEVQRTIQETTRKDSPGIRGTEAGISVDHELLRNLLVGASYDYTRNSYEDVDITDKYHTISSNLTYLWNRYLNAELDYTLKDKTSDKSHREYTENRYSLSVTGQF